LTHRSAIEKFFKLKERKTTVEIGFIAGMGLYYLLGMTANGFYAQQNISFVSTLEAFGESTTQSPGKVFTDGFNFSAYIFYQIIRIRLYCSPP